MSGLDVTVFPHDFAWGAATAAYQIEGKVYSSAHVYCSTETTKCSSTSLTDLTHLLMQGGITTVYKS